MSCRYPSEMNNTNKITDMTDQSKHLLQEIRHMKSVRTRERQVLDLMETQLAYYVEALKEERESRSIAEKNVCDMEAEVEKMIDVSKLMMTTSDDLMKEREVRNETEKEVRDLRLQMREVVDILRVESNARTKAEKVIDDMKTQRKSDDTENTTMYERKRRQKAEDQVLELKSELGLLRRQHDDFQRMHMDALSWKRQCDLTQYRDQFEDDHGKGNSLNANQDDLCDQDGDYDEVDGIA